MAKEYRLTVLSDNHDKAGIVVKEDLGDATDKEVFIAMVAQIIDATPDTFKVIRFDKVVTP
jgi:Asp-tRNA(Asn)/Glu-tRNA(Gln) amidotransferase B subunit